MKRYKLLFPLIIPLLLSCATGRRSSKTESSSFSYSETSSFSESSSKSEEQSSQSSSGQEQSSQSISSSYNESTMESSSSEDISSEEESSEDLSSSEVVSSEEESSGDLPSSEDVSSEEESSEDISSEESSEDISSEEQSSEEQSSEYSSSEEIEDDLWDHSQDHLRTGTKNIDFYNLNDLHGAVETSSSEPGIARISSYLHDKRDANPDGYVITSSGDMWQGSADSNITKGALVDSWMDYEGFSAMALGNHEFDWKISQIKINQQFTKTPFLACNIINKTTKKPVDWVRPYTTITRNGVHIGIIGAIGKGITGSIIATNVADVTFDDPTSYVATHASYLRENGADVILYLYHETIYSINDETASYVDAIFGGHNHAIEKDLINGTPAVEGKSNGQYVSHINLSYNFSTDKVSYGSYGYDDSNLMYYDENPDVLAIREEFADQINAVKNREVARIPSYLSKSNGIPTTYNRYAYRYYNDNYGEHDVYAVVTNNGRDALYAGIVTYGDIYKALPFDNYLNLIYVSGAHVKEICTYTSSHWYIPSVGNYHISYSEASSYFEDNKYYYVLTIDYISVSTYYSSWMNIVGNYMEEEALPRNIFSHYLAIDYPI